MSRHRNMRNITSEAIDEVYYDEYDEDYEYYDDDDGYGGYYDGDDNYAPVQAKKAAPKPKKTAQPAQPVNQPKKQTKAQTQKKGDAQKKKADIEQDKSQLDPTALKSHTSLDPQEELKLIKELAPAAFLKSKAEQLKQDLELRKGVKRCHMLMLGHVDSGKSSLLGRLLLEQGRVQSRTLDSLEKQSHDQGKGSYALAWLCDEETSERERGITVDVASQWFETPKRVVYVWDCPGHRDFVSNMLTAANHAKSCVLLASARPGEFESGFQGGQTREHAILAYGAGVRNVVVAVNKMDTIQYDKTRYDEIVDQLTQMLTAIGFTDVKFVPISTTYNFNISSTTSNSSKKASTKGGVSDENPMAWYKGPNLVDFIDELPPDHIDVDAPFCMAIHEVFVNPLFGLTISGKVLSGACVVKEKIALYPSGFITTIRSIQEREDPVQSCFAGDVVMINIKLNDGDDQNIALMSSVATDTQSPTTFATQFTSDIYTDMTLGSTPIVPGAQLLLHTQHLATPATITKIISVLGTKSKRFIPNFSHARVEIATELPIPILYALTRQSYAQLSDEEKQNSFKGTEFDRICLRREDETVATGNVLLVEAEKSMSLVLK